MIQVKSAEEPLQDAINQECHGQHKADLLGSRIETALHSIARKSSSHAQLLHSSVMANLASCSTLQDLPCSSPHNQSHLLHPAFSIEICSSISGLEILKISAS